ncbi:MAG: NTP transferase domain-containing protein [Thermoanaerobaculia bacterium]|nr:NTP transferase domain-containing protein [Thermoanaerobaculia bacterium]
MSHPEIPLIVLAGGDPEPTILPEGTRSHPLVGAKGMDIRLGGEPLIDLVLERLRTCGGFGPILVAGPAESYGEERDGVPVIDTDGTFGDNIRAGLDEMERIASVRPVAITTCDILPDVIDLRVLLDDYHAHAPLDFWYPLIAAPDRKEELGASAWKPQYRVIPRGGGDARRVLPGHLVIADAAVVYQELTNACFQVAYESRNRRIVYRFWTMIRHVLFLLIRQDLQRLVRLRAPLRTLTALGNGIALAYRLRDGLIHQEEIERRLSRTYIHRRHRRKHPERLGRVGIFETLSLAKDIDTEEEAEEREETLLGS